MSKLFVPPRMGIYRKVKFALAVAVALLPGLWTNAFIAAQGENKAADLTLMEALTEASLNSSAIRLVHFDVEQGKARLEQAMEAFDTNFRVAALQSHTYTPLTNYEHALALSAGINTYSATTNYTALQARGEKLFPSGVAIRPSFNLTRQVDNLENLGGVNRTNLNFQVVVPLLKGRGHSFTEAPKRLARVELQGTLRQANAVAAQSLLATAEAYWTYVAAGRLYELTQRSEKRASDLASSVATLIDADRLPASAAHPVRASLEQKTSEAAVARQHLLEARMALAAAMGLDAMAGVGLGAPLDPFPRVSSPDVQLNASSLVAEGLLNRPDLGVLDERVHAATNERDTARRELHNRLDLAVQSGYTGLDLGLGPKEYLGSTANRIQGADVTGSLTYTFDPANRTARGNMAVAQIGVQRAEERRVAARRQIANEVILAIGQLEASATAARQASLAVGEFGQALAGEEDRLKAGIGILNDVLTMQDRLSLAEMEDMEAGRSYAVAMVRLRYATGTLLGHDPSHPAIDLANFIEPPLQP